MTICTSRVCQVNELLRKHSYECCFLELFYCRNSVELQCVFAQIAPIGSQVDTFRNHEYVASTIFTPSYFWYIECSQIFVIKYVFRYFIVIFERELETFTTLDVIQFCNEVDFSFFGCSKEDTDFPITFNFGKMNLTSSIAISRFVHDQSAVSILRPSQE